MKTSKEARQIVDWILWAVAENHDWYRASRRIGRVAPAKVQILIDAARDGIEPDLRLPKTRMRRRKVS